MMMVDALTVGREAPAHILLNHPVISRVHAEVKIFPDGELYIRDCGSTNGTLLVIKK